MVIPKSVALKAMQLMMHAWKTSDFKGCKISYIEVSGIIGERVIKDILRYKEINGFNGY